MAAFPDISRLSVADLLGGEGVTFEAPSNPFEEEENEPYNYFTDETLTNDELLKVLNMEEIDPNDDDNNDEGSFNEARAVLPSNICFEEAKQKMDDILGNGKVMKLVKRKGVGEKVPSNGQVTIKYIGYFDMNDEPFDSTYPRGSPQTIRLGDGSLIPGLEIALNTMCVHEISVFIIHPDYAFGERGCLPRIPPNAEVMFAVHLLSFLDIGEAENFDNLSIEENCKFSNVMKRVNVMLLSAKDNFSKKKYTQAIKEYKRAINWLEEAPLNNDEEENLMKELLSKSYTNLGVSYNAVDKPRLACTACHRVPFPTAKTHYHYGKGLLKIGEYEEAMKQLLKARKLCPNGKDIIKMIHETNEKQHRYKDMEKRLWSKCLNGTNEKTESELTKNAKEFCQTFALDDNLKRQPLPEGLSPAEEKHLREQAAAFGLSVTTSRKYGKEITFLNKRDY